MLQVFCMVKWLDDNKLYHGDLQLSNLIVDLDTFKLKISTLILA